MNPGFARSTDSDPVHPQIGGKPGQTARKQVTAAVHTGAGLQATNREPLISRGLTVTDNWRPHTESFKTTIGPNKPNSVLPSVVTARTANQHNSVIVHSLKKCLSIIIIRHHGSYVVNISKRMYTVQIDTLCRLIIFIQ
jgi:hypothetical protein